MHHVYPESQAFMQVLGHLQADWPEGMFQGDIAEIILYNRKLNDTELAAVQNYLAGKCGK